MTQTKIAAVITAALATANGDQREQTPFEAYHTACEAAKTYSEVCDADRIYQRELLTLHISVLAPR